jgi:Dicarboxylate transport
MTPSSPSPDQPEKADFAPIQPRVSKRKPRSIKQFFLASSARLAIGLGVIGAIGFATWLARNELATTILNAFLRSKGIASDVTIENLQLGTAQISNLRLGPVDKPTFLAKKSTLAWHFDSKTKVMVIDNIALDDAQLRMRVTGDGKPDFGALAPFMTASKGPKRASLINLTLSNGLLLLDTPQGQVTAKVTLRGGETQGWRGRGDVTPPEAMIITPNAGGTTFVPIPIGFFLAPRPNASQDSPQATQIGFAARPNGQGLRYQGYDVLGITGDITGQLTLQPGGTLRIDSRPLALKISRITGPGLSLVGLDITTNPIFWSQAGAWQTTGWGNVAATGKLTSLQLTPPRLGLGATSFQLVAARGESGRIQIEYQGDVRNVSGPIKGRRIVAAGRVSTSLKDLTDVSKAVAQGKAQVTASDLVMPKPLRIMIGATAPPPIFKALEGVFSGSGAFDYQISSAQSQISMTGPLRLSSSTGARAAWSPDGRGVPSFSIKNSANGTLAVSGLGAGRISLDVPGLVGLIGQIEGASFGPNGWALIGANMDLQPLALTPDFKARFMLDRFNISAPRIGQVRGNGTGQVFISATTQDQGRARLNFDVRATPAAITGTVQGPFEGLGRAFGLGGYGARSGRLDLAGTARSQGRALQIDARGRLTGSALETDAISVLAPSANITSVAKITSAGAISGRASVSGSALKAEPTSRAQAQLEGLRFDVDTALSGTLTALQVSGRLTGQIDKGDLGSLALRTVDNETRFTGTLNRELTRFSGIHATSFARLLRQDGAQSGQIDVSGARTSGPFDIYMGRQGNGSPFWNGQLGTTGTSITTVLTLDAQRLRAASTSLTNVRLMAPTRFASNGVAWQSTANLDLAAQTLTTGDTRLNGVIASGPIALSARGGQDIRVATNRCLDFSAKSGTFPGNASVAGVAGKLCPDSSGQLAVVGAASPRIFATTELEPLAIQIGDLVSGQRLDLGRVNGKIETKSDGSLGVQMQSTQFGFSLKLPDGTIAQINATQAALDIVPQRSGIALKGRVDGLSANGLPVMLAGSATTDLIVDEAGLGGTFSFSDIVVKDADPATRFGQLRLVGSGTLAGNQVSILSDVLEPASEIKMATIMLSHDIAVGSGNLDVAAQDLLFSPKPLGGKPGLDVVTLIPPLRGVVSDMVGVANASANIAWSRNAPLTSRAHIETKGLSFLTEPGPVSGLAGDIHLDDIFLVRTAGPQTIKVGLFDPGLPIENGTVQFLLPGNQTLQLNDASWPFAEGKLSVRPATWTFRDGDQSFAIDVDDVDLAKLLRLTDVPNLEIDGKVSGVFPIEVRNGIIEIVGGRLKAREGGGVIRYTGPNSSPPPPPPGFMARVRQRFFGKPPPVGADLAIEALRALEYKILEITVDGRITGELQMGIILEGANQQVLSGQPFKFNIKMNVPIGQLVSNLNRLNNAGTNPEMLAEIDRVLREEAEKDAAKPAPPAPPATTQPPTGLSTPGAAPIVNQVLPPTPAP